MLIAIKSQLRVVERCQWRSEAEDVWLTLHLPSDNNIHLCCVYIPPKDDGAYAAFLNNLETIVASFPNDEFFICGYLILPNITWSYHGDCKYLHPSLYSDHQSTTFVDTLIYCGLNQF